MNFATFDLNLLRVLDAILREGSTVKAGERLGMSQSAVSGALARLRLSLKDQLFVRQGQGLSPTDYARSLAMPVHEELDRLEQLLAGPAAFDPAAASQTFKLAGSDFFAECLMPELAHALQTRAPGMRVQLVDLVPQSYVTSLERYEADMALIPDAGFPDWTDRKPLFWSSFTAIARKGHPEIAKAQVSPGEVLPLDLICTLGHVLFSPEGKLRAMGDDALARTGRERKVVMTMPVFSGVCRAVSESDLIALVPRQFAEKVAPALGLELYPLPFPIDPALIVGVWHKRSTANAAHKWMRDLVASILLRLNEGEARLPG
ncbi:MAG: LysR family transcriptional regulator [Devosia sp.]|uniref:LysR family transcriptional regulator n=1 Tax=Devosia sp. TaxID=1871048 RepID=UPI00261C6D5F|nr:LysR family transcriptional regulator [Devosia sp.]MDB5541420.1 LysR family transcriptional regulator [Devosia sp.]